jgi:hypothetical protein
MTRAGAVVSVLVLVALVGGSYWVRRAGAASCDAIVGRWSWFLGGEVTINPGGTFLQQSGNSGTWECADAATGRVTLRWRQGGFINQVAVSADGDRLTSTDPSQDYVTAKRIGAVPAITEPGTGQTLQLSTETDGARELPKELPQLLHAVTRQARTWSKDAIPVQLEVRSLSGPNPRLSGPEVRISFLSPSSGYGLFATVTTDGVRTSAVNQAVRWGTESLPPLFIDLPAAASIARKNGTTESIGGGSLMVWNPSGTTPVAAWMVGDKTVNAITGEIIDFDVTGYIERYNADWKRASDALSALTRSLQSSKVDPWEEKFDPYTYCNSIGGSLPEMCKGPR